MAEPWAKNETCPCLCSNAARDEDFSEAGDSTGPSPFEREFRKILLAHERMNEAIASIINTPSYSPATDAQLYESLDREMLNLMSAHSFYSLRSGMSVPTDVSGISTVDDVHRGGGALSGRSRMSTADEMNMQDDSCDTDTDRIDNCDESMRPSDLGVSVDMQAEPGASSRSGMSGKSETSVGTGTSQKSTAKSRISEKSTMSAASDKSGDSIKGANAGTSTKSVIHTRELSVSITLESDKSTTSSEQLRAGEN